MGRPPVHDTPSEPLLVCNYGTDGALGRTFVRTRIPRVSAAHAGE
ncbi:hypothetical protein [Tessaracoccus sp. MC1679]|nr:hypothetical protein [Tessaracoccus sp. MC1679]